MTDNGFGSNVEVKVDGNVMTIRCDLSRSLGRSSTGKTEGIASTHGWKWANVQGQTIGLSLNVNKK